MIKVNYVVNCDCCDYLISDATFTAAANYVLPTPTGFHPMGAKVLCDECYLFVKNVLDERKTKRKEERE